MVNKIKRKQFTLDQSTLEEWMMVFHILFTAPHRVRSMMSKCEKIWTHDRSVDQGHSTSNAFITKYWVDTNPDRCRLGKASNVVARFTVASRAVLVDVLAALQTLKKKRSKTHNEAYYTCICVTRDWQNCAVQSQTKTWFKSKSTSCKQWHSNAFAQTSESWIYVHRLRNVQDCK